MKKFYLLALVAAMFAACATDVTEDVAIEAPETLKVSFEESSRIQLDDNKTVWTKGDLLSVFYRSDANQQWKFQGNTGDRSGTIKRVSTPEYSHTTSKMVVAYPYNENYYLNPETCNLQAFLPAEQTYLKDSYGINGNIMVSQSEYKQFVLKSVCGWLKIQLTGNGEKVQSIKLKGNNGEQVAGEIYVNTADATSILAAEMGSSSDDTQVGGTMVEDDTILAEVTLNCGEGVTLGAEPTAFYIALPPQEFSKGLTVEIEDSNALKMTKSTDKAVVISRNTILPMEVIEYKGKIGIPTNQIWYTSSDGNVVTPYVSDAFGANIVSNTYENDKGVITFDAPITLIGYQAFYNCTSLISATLPDSVTEIGWYAFEGCASLKSVIIPDSVTAIGDYAFNNCTSLTSITIPNSVISIGNKVFQNCVLLTSAIIGNSVASIAGSAFYNCNSLTSVIIGNSVTEIGYNAFRYCSSLISVTIPDSVTAIRGSAFEDCTSLTSITIGNRVTSIGSYALSNCTMLTSITIPDSVTSIEGSAFKNCTRLTSVTIPDSVTKIEDSVFAYCCSLTSVTIGNSVTSIKNDTFWGCTALTSVTIGKRITSIGERAFCNCTSLTSITIPDSITAIRGSAFINCTSLKEAYCKSTTPPSGGSNMFNNNASGRKIYVPRASVDAYKAAEYWSDYKSSIEPYDFE